MSAVRGDGQRSHRPPVTAVVLCGGRARRMGEADKPLLSLAGKPLVLHAVARLAPQVDEVVLSCSRRIADYEALGLRVVADEEHDAGPLGGIVSAARTLRAPWLLTTPADTPLLPRDLVASLAGVCRQHGIAVARAGGRRQNLHMLLDRQRAASLTAFFDAGGRAAHRWLDQQQAPQVDMDADAFVNVNTAEQLARLEGRLSD